jgi:hypothetical protein
MIAPFKQASILPNVALQTNKGIDTLIPTIGDAIRRDHQEDA